VHTDPARRGVSLPGALEIDPPGGRSEQYFVYAILDAMVGTAFDALGEIESTLEGLQLLSGDMASSKLRMATLGRINSRLSRMRLRLGPQPSLIRSKTPRETIYWLTVVATIFLPLTFITGFFGMNFAWMVDHIDTALAFMLLGIGAPLLGVALTLLLVRRRATPVEPDRGRARTR